MSVIAASLFSNPERAVFAVRTRRARAVSLAGSLAGHGLALTLLISSVAGVLQVTPPPPGNGTAETAAPQAEQPFVEMVELPKPGAPGQGPAGLDPKLYQDLLRRGVKDIEALTPEEALAKLADLTGQVSHLSDDSLAGIGRLLGMDPDRYQVRTDYTDELNPNLNFHHATVVRASRRETPGNGAEYALTLEDQEQDAFTFTLRGAPARELEAGGLRFADTLFTGTNADAFELQGARIRDIQRGKRAGDPVGRRGSILCFVDPTGRAREVRIAGTPQDPLMRAQFAYARNVQGQWINDPADETTIFTDLVDMNSATLWEVAEAPGKTPGVKRARIVMLDAKGNRLIRFQEGKEAEETLARGRVLNANPTVRRIYEKTGAAGFLRSLAGPPPDGQAPPPPPKEP